MVSAVMHYGKVITDDINIKKPLHYYNPNSVGCNGKISSVLLYVYDLYYQNKHFMMLTDRLQVSFMSHKCVRFTDTKPGTCIYALKGIVEKIVERIRTNDLYRDLFENKEFHSCIDSLGNMITMRDICQRDTIMFDIQGSALPLDRLCYQDNVRLILYFKSVWINEKYYGLNIKVSQIERLEPLGLKKSLFDSQSKCVRSVPVPPPAPPPPPPPPPKAVSRSHHVKAWKVDKKKENRDGAPAAVIRPSLVDILNSRNKLRKTNILY